jgi:hypothetical protein
LKILGNSYPQTCNSPYFSKPKINTKISQLMIL